MSQSLKLSPNDYIVIGGIIAGAYIVYKVSKGLVNVGDTLGNVGDKISKAAVDAYESIQNIVPQGSAVASKNVTHSTATGSVQLKGLVDPVTFTGVSSMDPYDPTDPRFTSGQVYTSIEYHPFVQNKITNPFSFL